MTVGGAGQEGSLPSLSRAEAAELASRHGLTKVGVRPPLGRYIADIWRRRSFLRALAIGDFFARHQNNYLGLIWSLLNPLLLGVAYFIVFGLLLNTRGNVDNFIAFLISGLLVFMYISGAMNYAGRSMIDNLALVRSLRFPRVIVPLAVSMAELLAALPALAVIVVVVLATGVMPTWTWLLFPVGILIVVTMITGLGLLLARVIHEVRDVANLLPLSTRMLRYMSGVFFPVSFFAHEMVSNHNLPLWVAWIFEYQPIAVALSLSREALLSDSEPEVDLNWITWAVGSGWAILFLVVGFILFWRREADYGRA